MITTTLSGRTFQVVRYNQSNELPRVKVTTTWNSVVLVATQTNHGTSIDYPAVRFTTPEQVKDFARMTELLCVVAERQYLDFIISLPLP